MPQKSYSDFDVKIRKLGKYNISYKKNTFPVIRCQCIIIKRYITANLVHYHVIALHCLRISSSIKNVYPDCSYKTITILVKGTTFYFHKKKNTLRTMSSPRSINYLSSSKTYILKFHAILRSNGMMHQINTCCGYLKELVKLSDSSNYHFVFKCEI